MKRLLPSRYGSLLAAVLFSACTAAWAAPTVEARPQAPDAAGLMREAQRLNSARSLVEATIMAQAAMEAGRKGGAGEYTDLEAGALLVNLLQQQKRYDEARIAAEEQIAY